MAAATVVDQLTSLAAHCLSSAWPKIRPGQAHSLKLGPTTVRVSITVSDGLHLAVGRAGFSAQPL